MDDRLRRLERAHRESGTPEDGAALLSERLRAGTLVREVQPLAPQTGITGCPVRYGACRGERGRPCPLYPALDLAQEPQLRGISL